MQENSDLKMIFNLDKKQSYFNFIWSYYQNPKFYFSRILFPPLIIFVLFAAFSFNTSGPDVYKNYYNIIFLLILFILLMFRPFFYINKIKQQNFSCSIIDEQLVIQNDKIKVNYKLNDIIDAIKIKNIIRIKLNITKYYEIILPLKNLKEGNAEKFLEKLQSNNKIISSSNLTPLILIILFFILSLIPIIGVIGTFLISLMYKKIDKQKIIGIVLLTLSSIYHTLIFLIGKILCFLLWKFPFLINGTN